MNRRGKSRWGLDKAAEIQRRRREEHKKQNESFQNLSDLIPSFFAQMEAQMAENKRNGISIEPPPVHKIDIQGALNRGQFPVRHRQKLPTKIDTDSPHFCSIREGIKSGGITAVIGPRGTGKTQIATWAAVWMIEARNATGKQNWAETPAAYTTALEMFIRLRADQHNPESVAKFVAHTLLVIDEIQERGETDFEDRMLTHIIDRRYGAMKPTLLLGNLTPEKLSASLGWSIIDRIRETGHLIVLDGNSRRGNAPNSSTQPSAPKSGV